MKNQGYIFLDFDGVCTAYDVPGSFFVNEVKNYGYTPRCVELIKKLAVETGSKIVMSSNWRKFDTEGEDSYWHMRSGTAIPNPLPKVMKYFGKRLAVGTTSGDPDISKLDAVREWFSENGFDPEKSRYLVLDDCSYEGFANSEFSGHYIQTDPVNGFTDADYKKSLKILS